MFKQNARILFQGDSITDGGRVKTNPDLNHYLGHSYVFLIASRLSAEYPKKKWEFINSGVGGNRIVDLYSRWRTDTINMKPDVLSVLCGINDTNPETGVPTSKYERTYRMLLDDAKEANPNLTLVLCTSFVLPVNKIKEDYERINSDVAERQEVVKKLAIDYDAILVPFHQAIENARSLAPDEYWLWDGVHPMPAGHELLARTWVEYVTKARQSIID